MPIKAENRDRYPPNWPEIRARIQARAGNRCEACGVGNYKLGGRTSEGRWLPALPLGERNLSLEWPRPGQLAWCGLDEARERLRIIRIVCTVAHLDHTPENCADENLLFLCQRCHLRHDGKHHAQTAYETRRRRRRTPDMFDPSLR